MVYTIRDIAQRAGVSKSTVSRYLKDKDHKVSEKSRQAIARVVEELDYRPNRVAVGLSRQQLPMVGVVVSDITNPFSSVVIKGVFDACAELGYSMSSAISEGSASRERSNIKDLLSFNIDRLVIQTCGNNEEFLSTLNPEKTVIVDRPLRQRRFHTVTSDNYESTFNAITYLASRGCTPIAFLTRYSEYITTREIRLQAYLDAIKGIQEPLVVSFDTDRAAISQLTKLFASVDAPHGIFTSNGEALKAFLRFAKRRDLKVGTDLSVISFEDWDWMELLNPAITAVKQDSYSIGYTAAKELLEQDLSREENQGIEIIKSTLIERDSVVAR
ncbi:LacI family DNA-binding transcriptional regulator [Alloscardovia venturai]|uniref:LacI family DNA-binding transcriptional regulator n=1 Tax=Alloscardovia venturai TaxID=1769421 RepID=A0ABW2Y4D5_9BIFI